LSNLTSSSDHATQLFFLISAFSIVVILWDIGLNGNARLATIGCSEWAEMEAKAEKERLARIERTKERRAMLKDGRIRIGMTIHSVQLVWSANQKLH
jgi:hypothetical protein